MSRDEGFPHADVATAKHSDPKFRALWRRLHDEQAMNAAVVLYEAIQLTSWQHGERVTSEDAAPVWMTDVVAPTLALVEVGLLDSEARIPTHAWNRWFGTARERREFLRDKWRRAAHRRRKGDSAGSTPGTPPKTHGGSADPDRHSVSQSNSQAPKPDKGNGFKEPEDTEKRLARYKAIAEDQTKSPAIREAAQEQVKLMEAGRVH